MMFCVSERAVICLRPCLAVPDLQIYLILDDRQTLRERVSCCCYVNTNVLISTTMNVVHFARLPNVLYYVIVVALNTLFPT